MSADVVPVARPAETFHVAHKRRNLFHGIIVGVLSDDLVVFWDDLGKEKYEFVDDLEVIT